MGQSQTLFDALMKNGRVIDSPCGGKGTCGKCKVQIITGYIPEPSAEEYHHLSAQELALDIRLSCQLVPTGDLSIYLLQEDKENYQILSGGFLPEFSHHPHIIKKVFQQQIALLPHHRSCLDITSEILDLSGVMDQPILLQSYKNIHGHKQFTAVYAYNRLIGLEAGDTQDQKYGLAIDIGTTTVVISLIDLNEGKEIDSATGLNPQKANGQDVLSRIEFARKADNGVAILHHSIIDCLNTIIEKLCTTNQIPKIISMMLRLLPTPPCCICCLALIRHP